MTDLSLIDRPLIRNIDDGRIVIELLGTPVAKGRPRFNGKTGRVYSPTHTRKYESDLKYMANVAMRGRPMLEGALVMRVTAYLPVPESFSKKKHAAALVDGTVFPDKRPDLDNYAKAAADALNGVVFRDDAQIVVAILRKVYSAKPALRVEVEAL